MGFVDYIRTNVSALLKKDIRSFSAGEVATDASLPAIPWLWTSEYGVPIRADVVQLRKLAKSSWVQMVVNTITKQVLQTDYLIVPTDETVDPEDYKNDILKTETFLKFPNRNGQTFYELWGMFLRDVLELDRGIIVKGYNTKGEMVEMFAVDGSRFLTKIDEYGIIEGYYQYSFYSPEGKPKFFQQHQVISGIVNQNSERYPYGFSPLQSVQQEVELLINSTRYNKDFYKNNAIPDAIGVFDTDEDGMRRINEEWNQNVRGKAHKMLMTNAKNFDLKVLRVNNRDMEWLEGQKWYHHAIFGAYGLSPQEVGFYETSNRSTSDGQERTTLRNAVKPYMKLVMDKINREVIPELVGHDDIMFKWVTKVMSEEQLAHERLMDEIDRGLLTINEYRTMQGMSVIEEEEAPEPEPVEEPEQPDEDQVEQALEEEEVQTTVEDQQKSLHDFKVGDKWEAHLHVKSVVDLWEKQYKQ